MYPCIQIFPSGTASPHSGRYFYFITFSEKRELEKNQKVQAVSARASHTHKEMADPRLSGRLFR